MHVLLEALIEVARGIHVLEHALKFGSKLVATLVLEHLDNLALHVLRLTSVAKQSLRQVLLVIFLKHIFLLQKAEHLQGSLKLQFSVLLAGGDKGAGLGLRAFQLRVHGQRYVLRRPRVEVNERFKCLVERICEVFLPAEGLGNELIVLILELDEILHILQRLPLHLRALHDVLALLQNMFCQLRQDDALAIWHARKQIVHAPQILHTRLLQQPHQARTLLVNQCLHVALNHLCLDNILDAHTIAGIIFQPQACLDTLRLLLYSRIHIFEVLGGRARRDPNFCPHGIVGLRALEKWSLKILCEDRLAHIHQHLCHAPH
mmetsp:Transcript_45219/g.66319  ORF Transcript_45219/g.66319 Transcript_45219/m.66319 type:complete len:318 (-) Transcript_45219:253-1206(-)